MLHTLHMNSRYSNPLARVSIVIAPFFLFGLLNGVYNSALADASPWLFWGIDALGWVVLPVAILVVLYNQYGTGLADYGMKWPETRHQRREIVRWSILSSFLLGMYYFAFDWLAWEFIEVETPSFNYGQMVPAGISRYLALIYLAMTAAVFEEIFFRGLLWRIVFSSSLALNKPAVYIAVSSLLFGLVHWENGLPEIVSTTVFGIVACIIYLRSRNLLPLVVAHFCIDVIHFW